MQSMVGQLYGVCVILSEAKDLKTPVFDKEWSACRISILSDFRSQNDKISYFSRFSRMARMKSLLLRTVTSFRVVMRARSVVILP